MLALPARCRLAASLAIELLAEAWDWSKERERERDLLSRFTRRTPFGNAAGEASTVVVLVAVAAGDLLRGLDAKGFAGLAQDQPLRLPRARRVTTALPSYMP
jgi:hypothetical protein